MDGKTIRIVSVAVIAAVLIAIIYFEPDMPLIINAPRPEPVAPPEPPVAPKP